MYTLTYSWYSRKTNLWTESKEKSYGDIDSLKEELDLLCYDCHACQPVSPKDGEIAFRNGDKYTFEIRYNGRLCKKYANGI
jgi:hypothetical protein